MESVAEDVFKLFGIFATLWGLNLYRIKDGKLVLSKINVILSVGLVLGNVILTVVYLKKDNHYFSADFAKAETITFLAIFRDLGSTSIMVFTLVYSHVSSKKTAAEITKLNEIDTKLKELNLEENLKKRSKNVKKNLMILVIVENVIFNILGEICSAMVRDEDKLFYLLVNMYPRVVIGLVNCMIYSILMLIQSRFEMINELMSRKIEMSIRIRKYPNEFDFCDNIHDLVCLHKMLVKISQGINSIFYFQLLISITMNFILLIGDLHTSMYIIFFNLFCKHSKIVLDMVKNCVTYIFELFYLAKRAGELCNEANQTKVLLLGIRIDIDKENERNAVIVGALKLMQNKLEITACKLFTIDNALLFSICGAASSYLFIMLQLDIGNNSNNSTITENSNFQC